MKVLLAADFAKYWRPAVQLTALRLINHVFDADCTMRGSLMAREFARGGILQLSVAFQGGGARVIELMAAAEALRELSASGLEVFRVSGASAGAIAAAMYATGCDIAAIISQSDKLERIIKKHFGADKLKMPNILWQLSRGRPIFQEHAMRDALIALFDLGGIDARRPIAELVRRDIQLRIARSNIRYHNSSYVTEESETQLWEALADSAAIPFAFKLPGKNSRTPEILDGGLFQNLPAHAATTALGAKQVALGLSFEKEPAPDLSQATLTRYAAAILNSMLIPRRGEGDSREGFPTG